MTVRVLDLFCGGGGSSLGARRAGATIVRGVDTWERAMKSYGANFRCSQEPVTLTPESGASDLGLKKGQIDLLLASPECTNHTCAKGSAERSEESKLTAHYVLNFTRDLQPKWVVVENVIHMRNWVGFQPLLDGLQDLGYGVSIEDLDAVNFGVPQTRRRLFLLCEKGRIPKPLPKPRSPAAPVPAWKILDYDPVTGEDPWPSKELDNGVRAEATLERFRRGIAELGPGVPFLLVYYGSDGSGGWQSLDRPLRTITTLDRFGLVTWRGGKAFLRMLQPPELMRAMGIRPSDRFHFTGTRREQIMQIGNGVAPAVMEAIVRHLTGPKRKAIHTVVAKKRTGVLV